MRGPSLPPSAFSEPEDNPWIETFTGKHFHILDPQPEEICIEDIAHALANQCRFTGHTKRFYSIGEHCYRASLLVSGKVIELQALMHDSPEAYLCDMARPVKYHTPIGTHYRVVEELVHDAICDKFKLPHGKPKEVEDADHALLYMEKAQLMNSGTEWEDCNMCGTKELWAHRTESMYLTGFSPIVMERIFMKRFEELTSLRPATASNGPEPYPPTRQ